jgi:N-acetylglutamate synthase
MAVIVEPMTEQDYDEVIALWQTAEGVGLSDADAPEAISRYLARNPGLSLVARQDSVLVGAALCGHDGRRGFIHHLAVRPSHQRQGIGRLLVDRCLTGLAATGIQKCHLFVFGENQNALNFWRAIGWTERVELVLMSRHTMESGIRSSATG